MTDDAEVPSEPDWIRWAKVTDLEDLRGDPYMLRLTDDPSSPWRHVKTCTHGMWTDERSGARKYYMTVAFHNEDAERVLNMDDDVELGLIRPPWWPKDWKPNEEWPRRG